MTPEAFLSRTAGSGQEGLTVLWTKQDGRHYHFTDLADATAFALEASANGMDVYKRANVYRSGGTKAHDVVALTHLFLDVDIAGGAHKAKDLPTSLAQLWPVLDTLDCPRPDIILETGGGYHLHWLLEEPITDLSLFRCLGPDFQRAIRDAAPFHLDSTGDLARATRIPGTSNFKYDPPRPVKVLAA